MDPSDARFFGGGCGGEEDLDDIHSRLPPCGMGPKILPCRLPCKVLFVALYRMAGRWKDTERFVGVGACFDFHECDHAESDCDNIQFVMVGLPVACLYPVTVPPQIADGYRLAVIADGLLIGPHRPETE